MAFRGTFPQVLFGGWCSVLKHRLYHLLKYLIVGFLFAHCCTCLCLFHNHNNQGFRNLLQSLNRFSDPMKVQFLSQGCFCPAVVPPVFRFLLTSYICWCSVIARRFQCRLFYVVIFDDCYQTCQRNHKLQSLPGIQISGS